jgi:hypothetical protein
MMLLSAVMCAKPLRHRNVNIMQAQGQAMQWPKEKGQSLIYKTLHRKLIISTIAIYFFTGNKKKIFIFWTYKKSVISLQIFIINFSLRTVGSD